MILLGSIFMTSQVSAQMLRPSLESQMNYQTQVDIQVQANRRSAEADARLEAIRAKNQERMRALNAASTPAPEPQIDEQARNEALSRVVYRNPINGQSNAPIASVSADNPAVSVNYSPESRTVGNVDMARVGEWTPLRERTSSILYASYAWENRSRMGRIFSRSWIYDARTPW